MSIYKNISGVSNFTVEEYSEKKHDYVLLIPVLNEGTRILNELNRAYKVKLCDSIDIVICDGGSTDGSMNASELTQLNVNALLTKLGPGKQGAQLRMGMYWALKRGYKGIVTIDGNDKDSIEDVPAFVEKLKEGYDFIQGSRFIVGGKAINTPLIRFVAVQLIHAPVISITAHHRFTDTTNNFRAYSKRYLEDVRVKPFRDIFQTYELLAYLSVRASQIGFSVCEIPVSRKYPPKGKTPTKISFFKGNFDLLKILFLNLCGKYNP